MGMEKVKRYFSLQLKKLEIRFSTWNRGRDIAKAYEHPKPKSRIPSSVFRILIPSAVLLALVVVLVALAIPNPSTITDALEATRQPSPADEIRVEVRNDTTQNTMEVKQKTVDERGHKADIDTATVPVPPTWVVDPEFFRDSSAPVSTAGGNDSGMQYFVLANKRTRMLHLLERKTDGWSVLAEYPIAVGRNPGRKMWDGDLRTPEGQYFIEGKKEAAQLSDIYGPTAYVLNYPNWLDQQEGRTGSGIWIHGTAPDSMPVSTRGCIEMHNADLSALSDYLREGIATPVLIVDSDTITEPASFPDFSVAARHRMVFLTEYLQHQSAFADVLGSWAKAWESRRMSSYRLYYDTATFSGQGLEWEGWRRRKQRTFDIYDTIAVSFEDLLVTAYTESTATVKFIQNYRSDLLDVTNGKKLDFVRRNGTWLIANESTFPQEEIL